MILLGIDVETSGLNPEGDYIIELGAVVWDWEARSPVGMLSRFIDPSMDDADMDGFTVPDEIVQHTGITTEHIAKYGMSEKDVLWELERLGNDASMTVAHFGNDFDKLFMGKAYERANCTQPPAMSHWIDSAIDIKYPEKIKTRNLRHLASEHGFLNPFSHRAVFDVLTMFAVMKEYDLDAIIARSHEPTVCLQACVSFDEKEKAKERGYRWFAPGKIWWKSFKQSDAQVEVSECGFRTAYIEKPEE